MAWLLKVCCNLYIYTVLYICTTYIFLNIADEYIDGKTLLLLTETNLKELHIKTRPRKKPIEFDLCSKNIVKLRTLEINVLLNVLLN